MGKKTTRKNYHHGDLKQALLQAALLLVRTKGPRGFTLNEASRSAGVSVSAPYNHFKDKDALLIELVILGNETLQAELQREADKGRTDKEKLRAIYVAYIDFARNHGDLFAVMFQSGIDKSAFPEARVSAEKAFQIGLEVSLRLASSPQQGLELATAVWTMAHGFAMLDAEHAFSTAGNGLEALKPESIFARLLA